MARTDIHRPSAIDPDAYSYIAALTRAEDPVEAVFRAEQLRLISDHMKLTGGNYSKHDHGGSCHVCGAWFIDHAVFYHGPSNTYIRTGFDCAEKLGGGDPKAFKKIRDERHAVEAAKAGKMKATGLLRERGLLERVEPLFIDRNINKPADIFEPEGVDHDLANRADEWVNTVADMVRKLIKYGELSDKQWTFLGGLLDRIEHISDLQKARDEERANASPAPEGRQEVVGEVLSVKVYDSEWGVSVKMLVKEDRGFKVWSTVPKAIDTDELEAGKRVRFTGTLEPKADDPTFAIAKRPSKASFAE